MQPQLRPSTQPLWSAQGVLVAAIIIVSVWVTLVAPPLGPTAPPATTLAAQWAADPRSVDAVEVGYLSTAWDDTEGTEHTLTGLPAIAAHASATGPHGHAARAGLASIDQAIGLLARSAPATAVVVADRIDQQTPGPIVAQYLPQTWALIRATR